MKKLVTFLLVLGILVSLCACGNTGAAGTTDADPALDSGDASGEEPTPEEPAQEEPAEPAPAEPLSFMEEHGLAFSMQLSSKQPAKQFATSGSDYLSPDFCEARRSIVSIERSAPDEEGYVTYTLITEGQASLWFVYTDADEDGKRSYQISTPSYALIDRYTGTVIPGRRTLNDDAYDYTVELSWEGKTYDVSRAYSVQWDSRVDWDKSGAQGKHYSHTTDVVRAPAEYDGLCVAWYAGEPKPHEADEEDYELDLEAHVLCEDDFSELADYRFTSVDTVLAVLSGGIDTPMPAMPDGQIDDEAYQENLGNYQIAFTAMLDENGQMYSNYGRNLEGNSFILRGLTLFYDFSYTRSSWSKSGDEEIWTSGDPYPETVEEISNFMLENRSPDRQIALMVFDAEGNLLGSSGLLGPNEYLTHFALDRPAEMLQGIDYGFSGTISPSGSGYKSIDMEKYLVSKPAFSFVLYIYDMEGNLLATNSVDNLRYGNAWEYDWSAES